MSTVSTIIIMLTEFGFNVERKRKAKNIAHKEFAEKLGIHYTYYSKIINGERKPSADILEKICVLLDIDHNDLMGLECEKVNELILLRNLKQLSKESLKKLTDYSNRLQSEENTN
jgi:transcriptional regulator with XRE-family HTH domain